MKIIQSSIALAGEHASRREHAVQESLRTWVGSERPDFEAGSRDDRGVSDSVRLAISSAARQAAENHAPDPAETDPGQVSDIQQAIHDLKGDEQIQLLISLVEALTGHKIRLFDAGLLKRIDLADAQQAGTVASQAANPAPPAEQRHGWGLEYDRRETVRESEHTRFDAQGSIKTADGRNIEFSLSLEMKREFFSESTVSVRAGDGVRKDPLVINLNGGHVELASGKFAFDLDADGQLEDISFVGPGSGFLALDKNGNGTIDDGSELFGAITGNGFAELAAYDDDGNGWIDENDPVYARLLVWTRDDAGVDTIRPLAGHNIGALYLGSTSSPFDLNDHNNVQHGQVRSSGVFLYEDGRAGTMQQIDLFV